jgi:hypothetical protein
VEGSVFLKLTFLIELFCQYLYLEVSQNNPNLRQQVSCSRSHYNFFNIYYFVYKQFREVFNYVSFYYHMIKTSKKEWSLSYVKG